MSDTTLQSHMPILEFLLDRFDVKTALEFGCGLYSTPLLLRKCERVESREMNSQKWLQMVREHLPKHVADGDRWQPFWMEGPTFALDGGLYAPTNKFDLVLCDGHGDTRAQQAECMTDRSGLIVIHDSQHPETDTGIYMLISKNWEYWRIDFKDWRKPVDLPAGHVWPWTTVLVNNPDRAKVIAEWRDAG